MGNINSIQFNLLLFIVQYPHRPWFSDQAWWGLRTGEQGSVLSPNVHERQQLSGATSTHPHGEEDDEEGAGEHHPPGVRRGVPDGQGKRHGPAQTWESPGQRLEELTGQKVKIRIKTAADWMVLSV